MDIMSFMVLPLDPRSAFPLSQSAHLEEDDLRLDHVRHGGRRTSPPGGTCLRVLFLVPMLRQTEHWVWVFQPGVHLG